MSRRMALSMPASILDLASGKHSLDVVVVGAAQVAGDELGENGAAWPVGHGSSAWTRLDVEAVVGEHGDVVEAVAHLTRDVAPAGAGLGAPVVAAARR